MSRKASLGHHCPMDANVPDVPGAAPDSNEGCVKSRYSSSSSAVKCVCVGGGGGGGGGVRASDPDTACPVVRSRVGRGGACMHVCKCVCVSVCVRERETERECVYVRVCVCVCLCIYI